MLIPAQMVTKYLGAACDYDGLDPARSQQLEERGAHLMMMLTGLLAGTRHVICMFNCMRPFKTHQDLEDIHEGEAASWL